MSATKFHIELAAGQSIAVGDTTVTLQHKSGQRARLLVQAPADTKITQTGLKPATPSAHECASSPEQGKEHAHGQHPLRRSTPAVS